MYQSICGDYNPNGKIVEKDMKFQWNDDFQKGLNTQKHKFVTALILIFPDWNKDFHVHVDASSIELGVIFSQPGDGEIDHPIAFTSRKPSTTEKNYTTIECEGLAMVYTLQKFRHYLLGSHFKMYIDHSMLRYMVNKTMLGGEDLQMDHILPGV
jgi:hypothetical protein